MNADAEQRYTFAQLREADRAGEQRGLAQARASKRKLLREVLADAFYLSAADRAMVENYLRAARIAGLELTPESVRRSSDDAIRELWSGKAVSSRD